MVPWHRCLSLACSCNSGGGGAGDDALIAGDGSRGVFAYGDDGSDTLRGNAGDRGNRVIGEFERHLLRDGALGAHGCTDEREDRNQQQGSLK